ncbi:putative S-adenosyl-L-methionine-dependent methyltransferase [Lupinus albus]|uniref:Putative S-adenosyl-L-methionine-dependent methyltransferase n=1 Tax=Lupinus albus TaxID=3870 RepID=A0A6A4PBG1_LUPAL|nr:putative S-adenosyl-L-methionine-dependent methyltransferase [Lupinus albus]
MAKHFVKQAKQYADTRPSYPPQLFHFIASKTPSHHLAWDVGTGSGQAAKSIAAIYKNVIATDASDKQLEFAAKLPNVRYQHTPSTMSMTELEQKVAPQGTIDLVTIAQALHWFNHPTFYKQVKWVLKKPHGVIAAWCYYVPRLSDEVDKVFDKFYKNDSSPYWDPARKLVDDNYRNIDFPFEPVDGVDHTGPFEFVSEVVMDLEHYLGYIRSWSAYQTAKDKGVELLGEDIVEKFKVAWGENEPKVAKFPLYLRIGRVGDDA